jgi:hypothetical protein
MSALKQFIREIHRRSVWQVLGIYAGRQVRGGACAESTGEGFLQNLSFDDPRSAFNGVRRSFDINSNRVSNAEGPEV